MLGRLILRVGLLTLIFSTTLLSESIPFDYWYGRILGAHRLSMDYTDTKNGMSRYALSYAGGYRDRFQLGVPDLLLWTPNATGEKSDWTNPTINGALRLSNSTRYLLDRVDIRDDDSRVSRPGYAGQGSSDSYEWDQSVIHLDNGGVDYTPAKAAYLYLHGIWLAPRQTYVKMEADLKIGRGRSNSIDTQYVGEKTMKWNESRHHSAKARVDLRTGLSKSLNFSLGTQLLHSSSPSVETGNWMFIESDLSDSVYSTYLLHTDSRKTAVMLAPSLNWVASDKLWFDFGLNAWYDWFRSDIFESMNEIGDSLVSSLYTQFYERTMSGLELKVSSTWLSKRQTIENEQILDNFQAYYGKQLGKNTLRVIAAVDYSGIGDETVDWKQYQGGPPDVSGPYSHRSFVIDVAPDYALWNSLTIGARAQLKKEVDTDWHSQTFVSSLHIDYQNINWNREKRRDISWTHVNDIDYLLGAIMRPGDLRCSAELEFPHAEANGRNRGAGFWRLEKFRFNDTWHLAATSSLGVVAGAEVGLDMEFRHNYPYAIVIVTKAAVGPDTEFRNNYQSVVVSDFTHWYLTPHVRIQPLRWLRITSTAMNDYYRPYDIYSGRSTGDLMRRWQFNLKVDCVF